jgi:hypothetical protein
MTSHFNLSDILNSDITYENIIDKKTIADDGSKEEVEIIPTEEPLFRTPLKKSLRRSISPDFKKGVEITQPLGKLFNTNDTTVDNFICDIVFCFDTTGSMSSVIQSVRNNLTETIDRLFKEIKGLRIGLLSHGDYCDYREGNPIYWKIDLTNDIDNIKSFIKDVPNTGGGDAAECYEYMLKVVQDFNWKSNIKVFVIIADEVPHEVGYELPSSLQNKPELTNGQTSKLAINWKHETDKCKEQNIYIFSCHALASQNKHAYSFYNSISEITGGYYFVLDDLQSFYFYMNTICFKIADAADNLKIMKEKKDKLECDLKEIEEKMKSVRLSDNLSEEDKKAELDRMNIGYSNLTSAFIDLATYDHEVKSVGLFKSPTLNKSSKENPTSRVKTYINELTSSKRVKTESAEKFLNMMDTE